MDDELIRRNTCFGIDFHQTFIRPFSPKLYVEDVEMIIERLDTANFLSELIFFLVSLDEV